VDSGFGNDPSTEAFFRHRNEEISRAAIERLQRELASARGTASEALGMLEKSEKKREALQMVVERTKNRFVQVIVHPEELKSEAILERTVRYVAETAAHQLLELAEDRGELARRAYEAESNLQHFMRYIPVDARPTYGPDGLDWSSAPGAGLYAQVRRLRLRVCELESEIAKIKLQGMRQLG
jgi:hypothetical protein